MVDDLGPLKACLPRSATARQFQYPASDCIWKEGSPTWIPHNPCKRKMAEVGQFRQQEAEMGEEVEFQGVSHFHPRRRGYLDKTTSVSMYTLKGLNLRSSKG